MEVFSLSDNHKDKDDKLDKKYQLQPKNSLFWFTNLCMCKYPSTVFPLISAAP